MKKKVYSMHGNAIDKNGKNHIVTIIGECTQTVETDIASEEILVPVKNKVSNGIVSYPIKRKVRVLKYAYSICHPEDEFNEEVGIELAKKRLNRPLGELKTNYISCLTPDQINMILFEELNYIIENIDKFMERKFTN